MSGQGRPIPHDVSMLRNHLRVRSPPGGTRVRVNRSGVSSVGAEVKIIRRGVIDDNLPPLHGETISMRKGDINAVHYDDHPRETKFHMKIPGQYAW